MSEPKIRLGQVTSLETQLNTIYTQANNAYSTANAATTTGGGGYDQANNAYGQANAAYGQANSAYGQANSAYGQANAAYGQANSGYSAANTAQTTAQNAYGQANTATTNAGNAYNQANAAYLQANNAYLAANNSNLKLGGVITGTLNVTQDIIVGGNVYLEGNTTFINVATYSIEDSLMYIAANNILTDSVDIGFVGAKNTSGTFSHTGLARDATDGKYKLFDNLSDSGHVGNVIDFANSTIATLVANVEANTLTLGGNTVATQANLTLAHNQANNAYGQANLAYTAANNRVLRTGDTMTGILNVSVSGNWQANLTGTSATAYTQLYLNGTGRAYGVGVGGGSETTFGVANDFFIFDHNAGAMRAIIDPNGNVGIGTTSPRGKLDVLGYDSEFYLGHPTSDQVAIMGLSRRLNYGDVLLAKNLQGVAGADTYKTYATSAASGYAAIELKYAGDVAIYGVNGATTAGATVTPTARLYIQGSTGNVGVNTTSPGYKLDVNGTSIFRDTLNFGSGALISWTSGYSDGTTQTFNSPSGGSLAFVSNSSLAMFIKSNQNVGIGTSNPGYKLDVNTTGGSTATARLIGNDQTNVRLRLENIGSGGRIWELVGGLPGTNNANFSIRDVTGSTTPLTIDSSGNIGIGTTSPGYKLDVNGNLNIGQGSYIHKDFADNTEEFLIRGNASIWHGFISYTPSSGTANRGFKFGAWDNAGSRSDWVTFWNSYVGIGTTNPGQRLHIVDSAGPVIRLVRTSNRFDIEADNNALGFVSRDSGTASAYFSGFSGLTIGATTSTAGAKFAVRGTTDLGDSHDSTTSSLHTTRLSGYALRYDASNRYGNYGVLIFSASHGWTSSAKRFMITNGINANKFCIIRSVDGLTDPTLGDAGSITSGTADFTIDSSGNIGIGESTPSFKLDLKGAGGSNGEAYRNVLIFDTNTAAAGVGGGIAFGGYYSGTSSPINDFAGIQGFKENGTAGDYAGALKFTTRINGGTPIERMRITSAGRVGIGTATVHDNNKFQVWLDNATFAHFGFGTTTNTNYSGISLGYSEATSGNQYRKAAIVQEQIGDNAARGHMHFLVDIANDQGSAILSDSKMMIHGTNGRVGIGTTTPRYAFQVNKTSIATPAMAIGGAFYGGPRFQLYDLDADGNAWMGLGTDMGGNAYEHSIYFPDTGSNGILTFGTYNGTTYTTRMYLTRAGALNISGALSKGSGSFKIDHPLPEKTNTHHLVHSFIEGPQADLIYRGKVNLVNGIATVNIDLVSGMTEGTFVLLCRDVQCFTSNETDWDNVRGSVSGNILTIECQNPASNATISWMVIGERQDKHMIDTEWTDENGKVIVEPEKIIVSANYSTNT